MILQVKRGVGQNTINEIINHYKAGSFLKNDQWFVITSSKIKEIESNFSTFVEEVFTFNDDIQLASKEFINVTRDINLGPVQIGGETNNTVFISGPCSVESEEQIMSAAKTIKNLGIRILRAGCYKPRTSPYSFQGMGLEGLKLLAKVREQYGLAIITEVKDSSHVAEVEEYADIIQIGAKAMYDHSILRFCGNSKKPILLKRGFGSTLQEFVQAAEFILSRGNEKVILCERGIRTFETKTRFTLDLCGVAYLKEKTNLPIILDPSHAMGYSYGVPDLARACTAMGIDGLLIESHPNPAVAKSDASQQLDFNMLEDLYKSLSFVATSIGRNIV
jgi:3-deoxy-7-phosphoheptulonate synthase